MTSEELEQRIARNREAITAFQTSEVWKLWLDVVGEQIAAHTHNAVRSKSLEDREFARISVLAIEKFRQIPFELIRRVETISSSAVSKD